ncbi:MAG TPA: fumarylacetoacetate hydrolase family protein [Nocardioides sp.]|uniref:fumarylacetoacetate hydrolase family protein n=1 Tax=Nocardioides sp. TaxID=35761 RepID=UPI002E3824AE|nr:fumarylacetoacetate hydrolase family protein [Nocardioides sp.]HEX3930840.1 fumarylacetoacetate hydrolase family protein [Nocardioides sp.]
MKLASIIVAGTPSVGISDEDGSIVDIREVDPSLPTDMRGLIELGPSAWTGMDLQRTGLPRHPENEIQFLPVLPRPHAVWCAALNYPDHITEGAWDPPGRPPFFLRVAGSLVGHRQPMIQPSVSNRFDYEGELAVVIGRRARHVPLDAAWEVVAGYSAFNDGSVRDWQRHTSQITAGKNFTATGGFGPWLTTRDEVPDITERQLTTKLNGRVMQRTAISDMIFDIPYLINYLSTICELEPGDVIVTGTPGGVGARQSPQVFMGHGDEIEVEVDGVGALCNPIVKEES